MCMRSELAASSQTNPSGLSRLGGLVITATLSLLPAVVLAQVSIPSESRPDMSGAAEQYVLQVGAYADPANAARVAEVLEQKGLPSLTRAMSDESGSAVTRVLAGPYDDRDAALTAKTTLEADGLSGFVRTEFAAPPRSPAPQQQRSPAPRPQPVPVAQQQPSAAEQPSPVSSPQHSESALAATDARVSGTDANLGADHSVLFAQAQQDLFEVPPVVERPLGMDEGPRLVVKAIRSGRRRRIEKNKTSGLVTLMRCWQGMCDHSQPMATRSTSCRP